MFSCLNECNLHKDCYIVVVREKECILYTEMACQSLYKSNKTQLYFKSKDLYFDGYLLCGKNYFRFISFKSKLKNN